MCILMDVTQFFSNVFDSSTWLIVRDRNEVSIYETLKSFFDLGPGETNENQVKQIDVS